MGRSHPAIGVLMGGCSSEREVSLRSGTAVVEALKSIGHRVLPAEVDGEDAVADALEGLDDGRARAEGDLALRAAAAHEDPDRRM